MKAVLRELAIWAWRSLSKAVGLGAVTLATYATVLYLSSRAERQGLSNAQSEILIFGFAGLLTLYLAYNEAVSALRRRKLVGETEPPATLPERFSALAEQLSTTAQELQELQAEVEAQTAVARQLANQADERRHRLTQDRILAEEYREAAEAVERLLRSRVDKVAQVFERSNRRTQILYLALGAVLGYLVQLIGQSLT